MAPTSPAPRTCYSSSPARAPSQGSGLPLRQPRKHLCQDKAAQQGSANFPAKGQAAAVRASGATGLYCNHFTLLF